MHALSFYLFNRFAYSLIKHPLRLRHSTEAVRMRIGVSNRIFSVEMPTDTAEREQKPSLAWIMPSREEEKPTLCRINQHSLRLGCGMTPLKGVLLIFMLKKVICLRKPQILNFEFPLLLTHKTPLRGENSLSLELVLNQRILLTDSPHVKYGEAHLACAVCTNFACGEGGELDHITIAKTQIVVER